MSKLKAARGNTRKILIKVGEIQHLIGKCSGLAKNDRNPNAIDELWPTLDKAFDLCLEITGMYEQIIEKKNA